MHTGFAKIFVAILIIRCCVAVFQWCSLSQIFSLMVLMLLDCAVPSQKHCTTFSTLFMLYYWQFLNKRCTRTYLSSVTKQPFLLPVMCGEARCGFLFLWLTLLSDALDINIIVQQWPTRKTDLSLHISIRPAELSDCTMLCCRLPQAVISFGPPCSSKITDMTTRQVYSRGFKSRNVCLVFSFKKEWGDFFGHSHSDCQTTTIKSIPHWENQGPPRFFLFAKPFVSQKTIATSISWRV